MKKNGRRAAQAGTHVSVDSDEITDLFLAELEARRRTVRQLLRMVTLEAKRSPQTAPSSRGDCRRASRAQA